jgi:putative phosphoesterase
VLSDTHGTIPESVLEAFRAEKVDRIIHLGDYRGEFNLIDLEEIAPVTVVAGNNDFDSPYPVYETMDVAGTRIHMAHTPNDLKRALRTASPHPSTLALYGHTHVPRFETVDGITFANPGSPRLPRGGSENSVLILDIVDGVLTPRFVEV